MRQLEGSLIDPSLPRNGAQVAIREVCLWRIKSAPARDPMVKEELAYI